DGGCKRCQERINGKLNSGVNLERCLCTHAEANAIMQCALFGNGSSTKGTTLYSTFAPCLECSKMCITVGIERIVVLHDYPEDGNILLQEANIKLDKLKREDFLPWCKFI
ncbi:MAG: deoxycytidylate deaminase, partial [Nitrososphaeraceae archaeon]